MFKDLGVFSLICGVSQLCNCFILESAGSGMGITDPVSSSLVCQSCERNWLSHLDYSSSFCFLKTVKDLNIYEEHQLTSFRSHSSTMAGCLQQNVFKLMQVGSICNGFTLCLSEDTVWGFFSSAGGLMKALALGEVLWCYCGLVHQLQWSLLRR